MSHKTKLLSYKGRKVNIDEEIAPLISNMWVLGINTHCCCQATCSYICNHKVKIHPKSKDGTTFYESILGNLCKTHIWIRFESAKDIELFYALVGDNRFQYRKDSIFSKILESNSPSKLKKKYHSTNRWTLLLRPGYNEFNDFVIEPHLYFPRNHLTYVEERIKLALSKLK